MALKTGDIVPDFTVNDQDGNPLKLSDLRGKKVILYFYPKDMTPGCTAESCNLRDNYRVMQKQGYEILGVSTDTESSHRKFIEKEKLPFRLLADTNKVMHEAFGTWVEKSMYGRKYMGTARMTFIIDEKGKIEKIIDKVDTKNHASQILSTSDISEMPKVAVTRAAAKPKSKKKKVVTPKGKGTKKTSKKS
jgi:thioredoxin-dependent peroxiredoxin